MKLSQSGGSHIPRKASTKKINYKTILNYITKALEDKKAVDICITDVTKQPTVTDYIVIATAAASTHLRALANGVEEILEKKGYTVPNWQGKDESNWLILDIGAIIVHVMGVEERKKYSLEEIWGKATVTYHM